MIHSFLLIGQSNMAGRGFENEVSPIKNDRIKVMRNGLWQDLFFPVNPDRAFSGVNLAESFADEYTKDHDVSVGLIPCADGGTSLSQWEAGGILYDNAVFHARLAMRTSRIAGVLWHQGESDCGDADYPLYEERFLKIMNSLRRDLGLSDIPFLVGGLGDYLSDSDEYKNYVYINRALEKIVSENDMMGFVSAKGLSSNPDKLHFNAKSLREFGIRYYKEFRKLEPDIRLCETELEEVEKTKIADL